MFNPLSTASNLSSDTVIRFQDCDPFGHLNNACYLDYFLNARYDQLKREWHFDLFELTKQRQQNFVVKEHRINYNFPAFYGESVLITSRIIHLDEKNNTVEFVMTDAKTGRLLSYMWSVFQYIDLTTGRSIKHPQDIQMYLQERVHSIVDVSDGSFKARLGCLKKEVRAMVSSSHTPVETGGE